jgi:ankyrin repeat protein
MNAASDTLDTVNAGLTALAAAVWYGHTTVCSLLLEAGADPDIQSLVEGSALNYAITFRRSEMAGWLLDYGADPFPKKKNALKATPLEAAITLGDGRLVPRMLGQDPSNPLGIKSRVKSTRASHGLRRFM